MKKRLPAQAVSALLAPMLLWASAAQGLVFMRCGTSVEVAASCCCHSEKSSTPAHAVLQPLGACCDRLTVPPAQAQVDQRREAPVPALLAVAVVSKPLALVSAIRHETRVARLDPPPAPSPLLASCAFLI